MWNNRVTLAGYLTKDIELSKTASGKVVCQFTLGVSNAKKETNFVNCVTWEKSAEYLDKYATKGSLVALDGHIQVRSYTNKDGRNVSVTEVVAESVHVFPKNKPAEEVYEEVAD